MEQVKMASLPGSLTAMIGEVMLHKSVHDGKIIKVEWPDGTVTTEKLLFREVDGIDYDHGHEYHTVYNSAYFVWDFNGLQVDFRLDGRFKADLC